MKRVISVFIISLMILGCMGIVSAEGETDKISISSTQMAHIRGGSYANTPQNVGNMLVMDDRDGDNERMAFIKVDLKNSVVKIANSTEIKLDFATWSGGATTGTIQLSILPDVCEQYFDPSTLTYNIAKNNGMLDAVTSVNTIDVTETAFTISKDALSSALAENPFNSVVIFRLSLSNAVNPLMLRTEGFTSLSISYDSPNEAAYVAEKSAAVMQFSEIDGVNSVLPTQYYGMNITWNSALGLVNSDGTINRPGHGTVELTANFSYGEATGQQSVTVTIVSPPTTQTSISPTAQAMVRGGTYMGADQNDSILYANPNTSGNDWDNERFSFIQFNVANVLESVRNGITLNLSLCFRGNAAAKSGTFKVALLSDSCDDWDSSLTYEAALQQGMLNGGETIWTQTFENQNQSGDQTLRSDDFLSAVQKALANGNNTLLTFRIESEANLAAFRPENTKLYLDYSDDKAYALDLKMNSENLPEATVRSNFDDTCILVFASYNDKKLIDVSLKTVDLTGWDIFIPENLDTASATYVRAMLFDGRNILIPLCAEESVGLLQEMQN